MPNETATWARHELQTSKRQEVSQLMSCHPTSSQCAAAWHSQGPYFVANSTIHECCAATKLFVADVLQAWLRSTWQSLRCPTTCGCA